MTRDELSELRGRDVSRETYARLETHAALLAKWNPKINLVSPSTLAEVWSRHILDSIQIFDLNDRLEGVWVDIGTGGGFPGLVIAILAAAEAPGIAVHLVESDLRKSAFLATCLRETGVTAKIHSERAESLPSLNADVLSARALASLTALLGLAERHLAPEGLALFPKGANHQAEIDEALATWRFRLQKHPSKTDPLAVILAIEGLSRV
ncbi:16S rRNA (guanine(527)-N(7))-methyltransferase RsmG [Ostreiculturibacter nitratireducens]|uniref:16S rRNA (guanine(527)-N(7))-methyltransferase RsmG n=1 Tax=Ostreiculturibacter nitratireducens TaxID=3075226 RepID=UPI0031B615DD